MKVLSEQTAIYRYNNPAFKGIGTAISSEIQSNAMMNRSLIDMFGVCVPWAIMANNKDEKREKIIRFSIGFVVPFLTPFITLPISNKLAMKYIAKITKKLASKEHKAIWLSNKYLKTAEETKEGLAKLAKKHGLNEAEILDSVQNNYENLRKKIISSISLFSFKDLFTIFFGIFFFGIGIC